MAYAQQYKWEKSKKFAELESYEKIDTVSHITRCYIVHSMHCFAKSMFRLDNMNQIQQNIITLKLIHQIPNYTDTLELHLIYLYKTIPWYIICLIM